MWTCRIFCGAWDASTTSRIGPGAVCAVADLPPIEITAANTITPIRHRAKIRNIIPPLSVASESINDSFRLLKFRSQLREKEAQNLCVLLNDFGHGPSFGMPQLGVVEEQDGLVSTLRCLHARRHFSRVQRSDPCVAIARQKEDGGIFRSRHDMVVWRVGINIWELSGVFRGAVLSNPQSRNQELLIAHHVQKRISARNSAKQIRPLRHGRAHKSAAVAA